MPDREEPLYVRVARALEDDILTGLIQEGEPVPSTNQYAAFYRMNPATAAKGVAVLTEQGLLFKKRGIGLFVAEGAREKLLERRREAFKEDFLEPLLAEAHRIGVGKRDLLAMLMAAESEPYSN